MRTIAAHCLRGALNRVMRPLLVLEGKAGLLGPAHRFYSGNTVEENRQVWSGWDWTRGGEEWTLSLDWKRALVNELILPYVPEGSSVLEIGPGAGRWTEILAERAGRLTLVDVSDQALAICRERFGDDERVSYYTTTGTELHGITDSTVDAIWSFDVFVHIAPRDVAAYIAEMGRVMRSRGMAVLHHSGGPSHADAWRSPMTATLLAKLAAREGFVVERQITTWAGGRFSLPKPGDRISILRRT